MHFKLDENVPVQLGSFLGKQGHTSSSVFSQKMSGARDQQLIARCTEENAVLITLDSDFTNVRQYPPSVHCGIIVLRLPRQGARSVVAAFEQLAISFDLGKSAKKLVIVERGHIRVRT